MKVRLLPGQRGEERTLKHPGVVKAQEIASLAVAQDPKWSGKIDSEVVDGKRITRLTAQRNDESIEMTWRGAVYLGGTYRLFDHAINLASASVARSKITGFPNIYKVRRYAPKGNKVATVAKYRRVPFDWQEDDPQDIINTLIDRRIYWYHSEFATIHDDVVLKPKGKKTIEIKPVGHRKLLSFIGTLGFRSVLLDTIIQVGG